MWRYWDLKIFWGYHYGIAHNLRVFSTGNPCCFGHNTFDNVTQYNYDVAVYSWFCWPKDSQKDSLIRDPLIPLISKRSSLSEIEILKDSFIDDESDKI